MVLIAFQRLILLFNMATFILHGDLPDPPKEGEKIFCFSVANKGKEFSNFQIVKSAQLIMLLLHDIGTFLLRFPVQKNRNRNFVYHRFVFQAVRVSKSQSSSASRYRRRKSLL
jgi:hypothetical protein